VSGHATTEDLFDAFERAGHRVATDSRKVQSGDLFFALKGPRFDGHDFVQQAIEVGVTAVVVDQEIEGVDPARCLRVPDVLSALQELAHQYRSSIGGLTVIGITGSNGKTTTKELVHAVLSAHYRCYATPGNLNNSLGVPLTLLGMPPDTEFCVVEMGANHPGEVMPLCVMADPDVGLVTAIGKEHLEGFGSLQAIIDTETELYAYLGQRNRQAFTPMEVPELMEAARIHCVAPAPIYYGSSAEADCVGRLLPGDWAVRLQWENSYRLMLRAPQLETQLFGAYNFNNIMAAACLGRYFSVPYQKINQALANYTPSMNRSQLVHRGERKIILDAYNANPHSMQLAVTGLAALTNVQRVALLGDMMELGAAADEEHEALLQQLVSVNLEAACLCGPLFMKHQEAFPGFDFFPNVGALLESGRLQALPAQCAVLVKGSRSMGMERCLEGLG
jgi:UDP-N-acetylmuramoyl-tripeptide--D-alanyl-D-alanine ligase